MIFWILSALAITGRTVLPGGSKTDTQEMGKRVCVYTGVGAVLARDVEAALNKLAIPYGEVDERDIREGRLRDCSALIIPGGYTARYVDALGKEGFERIRASVADGAGYIGICAGAYIAAQRVEVPGHPPGLGIIDIRNERRAGRGIRTILTTKPGHPVVKGCEREIEIWYQNGPMIKTGEGIETLAMYDKGSAAIVCATYGVGRVLIFSPHPEGSLERGIDPQEFGTLKLLENALTFACRLKNAHGLKP